MSIAVRPLNGAHSPCALNSGLVLWERSGVGDSGIARSGSFCGHLAITGIMALTAAIVARNLIDRGGWLGMHHSSGETQIRGWSGGSEWLCGLAGLLIQEVLDDSLDSELARQSSVEGDNELGIGHGKTVCQDEDDVFIRDGCGDVLEVESGAAYVSDPGRHGLVSMLSHAPEGMTVSHAGTEASGLMDVLERDPDGACISALDVSILARLNVQNDFGMHFGDLGVPSLNRL